MFKRIFENIISLLLTKSILEWLNKRKGNRHLSAKDTKQLSNKLNEVNADWNKYSKYKK